MATGVPTGMRTPPASVALASGRTSAASAGIAAGGVSSAGACANAVTGSMSKAAMRAQHDGFMTVLLAPRLLAGRLGPGKRVLRP